MGYVCIRLLLVLAIYQGCDGIRLLHASIDSYVVLESMLTLTCEVDTEGQKIYQSKWYKDGREFYRYQPTDDPPGITFSNNITRVDMKRSDSARVVIGPVRRTDAGKYGCEITTQKSYDTVTATGEVLVVELPQKELYTSLTEVTSADVGDVIRTNCTSVRSRPMAELQWFINNEKARGSLLTRYPTVTDSAGLKTSVLGIDIRLNPSHFRLDQVTLKCTASIENVYYASRQIKLRRLSQAQVYGAGSTETSMTMILLLLVLFTSSASIFQ